VSQLRAGAFSGATRRHGTPHAQVGLPGVARSRLATHLRSSEPFVARQRRVTLAVSLIFARQFPDARARLPGVARLLRASRQTLPDRRWDALHEISGARTATLIKQVRRRLPLPSFPSYRSPHEPGVLRRFAAMRFVSKGAGHKCPFHGTGNGSLTDRATHGAGGPSVRGGGTNLVQHVGCSRWCRMRIV
jgi:hypothetical protein